MKRKIFRSLVLLCCILFFTACGTKEPSADFADTADTTEENEPQEKKEEDISYDNLVFTTYLQPEYAEQFKIEKSGEYLRVLIAEKEQYLVIPEGLKKPQNTPDNLVIMQKPFDCTYLSASSVFDLMKEVKSLKNIRFSGIKEQDLFIDEAVNKLKSGEMLYAGKYSAPDYEMLLQEGCNLAIESTMIYHNPETKEKLEDLGIPVFVEHSSYESHPLGRLEWMKLYGVLFDEEALAMESFENEKNRILPILEQEKNGCRAAFFHVNSNGTITVRKPGDYIAKMIELAGGEYAFSALLAEEENALSTMNIQVEDFYLYAKDADVLIYNSTIEGELFSLSDFLKLNEIFSDLKAVKENRVYCTGKNFFQETTGIGAFVEDLNTIFRDSDETLHYMWRLE